MTTLAEYNDWLKSKHPARNMTAREIVINYPCHWEPILQMFYPELSKEKSFDWNMM